ncbi:MAG: type II toxin-antitoxin system prevent-host-death family antitoxin [Armatimonadetes bacterium]|nr:type II toxin-antitoxin system prevent-host-death family antitoxin [Armatimonadota bacterium]
MSEVTAKELKNRTGEILRRVRDGETVTVTVRGERVARFVPLKSTSRRRAGSARMQQLSVIRAVAGKYRGWGTVDEFLQEKRRQIARER